MTMTHAVGSPSWFELATSDQTGAEAFYAALFGWTVQRNPMGEGSHYTMFQLGGRDVAAAYTLMPDQAAPPKWDVYFKVDDIDAIAAKAATSGGSLLMPPFEVEDYLRMAVCADAENAAFSLHQPRQHAGAGAIRENNAICWVELATRDLARAEAFYTGLFGWNMSEHHASPPSGYRLFGNGDGMLGGLLRMTEEWGEMLSHWSIYIQVEDVDAIVAHAETLGGKLCFPAFDAPGVGRLARIEDPAGAGFYVIKFVDAIQIEDM
jgi:predicted enzyme related to lactoylglutathione lyase